MLVCGIPEVTGVHLDVAPLKPLADNVHVSNFQPVEEKTIYTTAGRLFHKGLMVDSIKGFGEVQIQDISVNVQFC